MIIKRTTLAFSLLIGLLSLLLSNCQNDENYRQYKDNIKILSQETLLPVISDSTDTQFVWIKGGWVKKDEQILLIDKQTYTSAGLSKGKALQAYIEKISEAIQAPVELIKTCDCSHDLYLLRAPGLHNVDITPDPSNSSSGNNAGTTRPAEGALIETDSTFPIQPLTTRNLYQIAVLDTGLDTLGIPAFRRSDLFETNQGIIKAYDFTASGFEQTLGDNDDIKHGTHVTSIVSNLLNGSFRIIPMKIMNKDRGNLFDAACALFKAGDLRVRIINNSWGHSGAPNEVLHKAVSYLQSTNSILVCSTGNDSLSLSTALKVNPDDNSKNTNRYPAMFSRDFSHVIAVTTNAPRGNRSGQFTNILVRSADPNLQYTSYAAAFVSNKLANFYAQNIHGLTEQNTNLRSDDVVRSFYNSGIFNQDNQLFNQVENGRVIVQQPSSVPGRPHPLLPVAD